MNEQRSLREAVPWTTILVGLGLAAVTLWLFWPATGYDFLNFDDDRYVAGNQMVRSGLTLASVRWAFHYIYESYWLPVMWLSYMLDSTLYGTQAFGYHATNILLHAANAALLFVLLRSWIGRLWPALFAAALFAWHPLRVESVAWIAERKDVLSGFFFMLCLFFYRQFSRNPSPGREVPAALFMALGLMTKPMLVTLPFLLLLLDYWPLERWTLDRTMLGAKGRKLIGEKVLFWALALLFCYITYYTQRTGNAIYGTDTFPWARRLAYIPVAYAFYLVKFFLPIHLSMLYGDLSVSPLRSVTAAVLLLGITVAALWIGKRTRAVPVGWFWFLGLLVPVIGVVRVGVTHVADRFTYLPSIGLCMALAWGFARGAEKRPRLRVVVWALAVAVLVGCLWQTRRVLPRWSNSLTAFENVLRYLPDNPLANNNYGEALLAEGQTELALRHFDQAIAIDSNTTPFIANSGIALLLLGRTDEAIGRVGRALAEKDPNCPFLNFAMGLSWMENGNPGRAIPYLRKANEDPMMRPTWRIELARAYTEAGRTAEASNEFALVASRGWGHLTDFQGMCNYYAALWQKGHGRRSWTFFERTLSTQSNNVSLLNNVAWFLATDPPPGVSSTEAVHLAQRAVDLCEVVPANVMDTLAAAYAADGQFDQAVRWSAEALNLAVSNGWDGLAQKIEERNRTYRAGKAWGRTGPVDRASP